jgi:hypothetical protein
MDDADIWKLVDETPLDDVRRFTDMMDEKYDNMFGFSDEAKRLMREGHDEKAAWSQVAERCENMGGLWTLAAKFLLNAGYTEEEVDIRENALSERLLQSKDALLSSFKRWHEAESAAKAAAKQSEKAEQHIDADRT